MSRVRDLQFEPAFYRSKSRLRKKWREIYKGEATVVIHTPYHGIRIHVVCTTQKNAYTYNTPA